MWPHGDLFKVEKADPSGMDGAGMAFRYAGRNCFGGESIMTEGVELGRRGVLHPGKLRWLRALGWMIALAILVILAFGGTDRVGLFVGLQLTHHGNLKIGQAPAGLGLIATLVSVFVCLSAYAAAVRYGENRRLSELALRPLLPELAIGILMGAAIMVVTIGLLWALGAVTIGEQPVRSILGALNNTVESGVFEETLLRLVVFRLLWRAFGIWAALALSALLFGFLHLANPNATLFAAICIAFEAGVVLAAFYILTGRVWVSIGVHMGWNFTQGWIFGAAVSGTSGFVGGPLLTRPVQGASDVLSGGGFGPEASFPCLVVCTAAGVGVLWLAARRGRLTPLADSAADAQIVAPASGASEPA
jgi:membrane protease YdiL (CAAX protease family)